MFGVAKVAVRDLVFIGHRLHYGIKTGLPYSTPRVDLTLGRAPDLRSRKKELYDQIIVGNASTGKKRTYKLRLRAIWY